VVILDTNVIVHLTANQFSNGLICDIL